MYIIQLCLQVRTWIYIHNTTAERNSVAGALLPYLLLPVIHTAQLAPPEQRRPIPDHASVCEQRS
jgi:hypothetical protein